MSYASRPPGGADRARDIVQNTLLWLCARDQGEVEHRLAEWLFTVLPQPCPGRPAKGGSHVELSVEQGLLRVSHSPEPIDGLERREEVERTWNVAWRRSACLPCWMACRRVSGKSSA